MRFKTMLPSPASIPGLFPALVVSVLGLGLASSARADDTYAIHETDVQTTVGSPAKAQVTITAKKGWHLNAEAPFTLKLTSAQGITLDKAKLVRADLALSTETSARFDIGLTATQPGTETVSGEAGFVLCQESACRPIRDKLSFAVTATKAQPAKKASQSSKRGKQSKHRR